MTQPEAPDTHHSDPPSGAAGGYRPGYEIAAERILEYIAAERLRPGDRLPTEKDLADAVQMTRTVLGKRSRSCPPSAGSPCRRAAASMSPNPTPRSGANRTPQFLPTDLHQVDEMFEFRRFTEITTARLAAQRATPTQVKALREAAQQTADAAQADDIDAFNRADEQFHGAVGTAASNMFLSSSVDAVQRLQLQVSVLGLAGAAAGSTQVAAQQHLAIAEAIADGDDDHAAQLMSEHIDVTWQQFKQRIHHHLFPH